MEANNDTTGQIVMHHRDMGTTIVIARDNGDYDGTVPEMGVRRLETLETIDIDITHPEVKRITVSVAGYGCGWGDTGRLYPVTADDIQRLRDAADARPSTDSDQADSAEWTSPRGLTLTEEMDREDTIY